MKTRGSWPATGVSVADKVFRYGTVTLEPVLVVRLAEDHVTRRGTVMSVVGEES